jgi:hypothetical protein
VSAKQVNARELLEGLRGTDVFTLTRGSRNRVLRVEANQAIVATDRSPAGERVELAEVQAVLDRLREVGELTVNPRGLDSHRSSFIAAALATLPEVVVEERRPRVLRWSPQDRATTDEAELDMSGSGGDVRPLELWGDYTRSEIHDIFSPDTEFHPGGGTWGMQGLIRVPQRDGDFVFLVSFGRRQAHHDFEESITEDGVLSWQSQPRQGLNDSRVQELISHDDRLNTVHLFLRNTTSPVPYTYLGPLGYLTHDPGRERPVYFDWQLLEWPPPPEVIQRLDLVLAPPADNAEHKPPGGRLEHVDPPPPAPPLSGQRRGAVGASRRPLYAERDARNEVLGRAGEELVVDDEIAKLRRAGRDDLADRVVHVSAVEGDSAGYDVRSFDVDGRPIHIEVKTTRGGKSSAYFLSANELAFSEQNRATYRLYRLFEFDDQRSSAKCFIVQAPLNELFELEPTEYRARLKRQVSTAPSGGRVSREPSPGPV